MKAHIYMGGYGLIQKSGVGRAILHQMDMLRQAGIETTTSWSEPADTIHINTVFPDSVLAALRARRQGKRVIWYGHSTMEDFRNSFKGSNFFAPLFRRWLKFCYDLGDVVLTPTPYSKRLLESYGLKRPVFALSNGIDADFFSRDPKKGRRFRAAYGIPADARVVLSAGHYIARKGLVEFCQLARSMPETLFFWFGYTNLRLVPREIRDAMANAPENLRFPGYVSREALRDAYCGADVFAFLSHEETEGIVVLEALACGLDVVVRDIPVYEDWLTDGGNVYKAADSAQFCRIVGELLDKTRPSLAPEGVGVARQRSMAAMGVRLKRVYRELGLAPAAAPRQGWLPYRL